MKVYYIVFILGALAFVSAEDATTIETVPENLTSPAPTPSPPPPPTSTTQKPIPTTTKIPDPVTTSKPDPITTPKSTTQPPTTRKSTTPASTTASTSTPAPSTPPPTTAKPITTSAAPSPTTPPTPAPTPKEPEVGKWSLNYTIASSNVTSNFTCLTVQLALQAEVHYISNKNTTAVGYVNLPKNATVNGTCGSDSKGLSENMILTWDANNTVTLSFKKDNKTSMFYLDQIVISLQNLTELPGSNLTSYNLVHQHAEFNTTGTKSYKCDKIQNLKLFGAENKTEIHVSNVRMQAFTNTTNGAFLEAENCEPLETPDVVPIAVGCSLVILVVVVLAAYLIGRRRREGRGYLSM